MECKKVYIETYGCRMNICDSEVILSILSGCGYEYTNVLTEADCVILNCCSVREIGHEKAYERVSELERILKSHVILVIAGCMSTQLDESFFEICPRVQLVIHPTSYKYIPEALNQLILKQSEHLFVMGSDDNEIYDRLQPLRMLEDKITAAVTIMKGCDIHCSYCIEPYTRGGRVNRSYNGIMTEIADIRKNKYQEITLFGHIVDLWQSEYNGATKNFAQLLSDVAESCPEQRIKFISSHPLTFTDQIANVIAGHNNIMKVVHLPVQSGSDRILNMMNRKYTVSQFIEKVDVIRRIIPDINIVTDIMVGFPGEKEKDFEATLNLLAEVRLTSVNVFKFSMRKGTPAYWNYNDDVPLSVKEERQRRVHSLIRTIKKETECELVGTRRHIIVESKDKDSQCWFGRDMNHRTIYFVPVSEVNEGAQCDIIIKRVESDKIFGEVCL